MGKEIEKIAIERNHHIVLIIDKDNINEIQRLNQYSADVAIEFTTPETGYSNVLSCLGQNIPVVSGTTGWSDRIPELKELCRKKKKTLFWASNFSIGVNLQFALNSYLARLMNSFENYGVTIEEVHHTQKLDSPSGTAITLAEGIISQLDRKSKWTEGPSDDPQSLKIHAVREDAVPGTHTVSYESDVDILSIRHEAKSRKGFALGAILAAEFVYHKTGFFTMQDLLNLQSPRNH